MWWKPNGSIVIAVFISDFVLTNSINTFASLKSCITYILSFYILFCAVVPCSMFDNCEEEHTGQTSRPLPLKECNGCSPFSTCSSANSFIISHEVISALSFAFPGKPSHNRYPFAFKSEYYFSFFQPPELMFTLPDSSI